MLKFFIPLYKACRKLGLNRNDIYFGIKGSREFFIKDTDSLVNCGGFFDFTIPSLGMVIEYNGSFWHPRDIDTWRNPMVSFNDAMMKEEYKRKLVTNRGFEYIIVWCDDDHNKAQIEILEKIKCKLMI